MMTCLLRHRLRMALAAVIVFCVYGVTMLATVQAQEGRVRKNAVSEERVAASPFKTTSPGQQSVYLYQHALFLLQQSRVAEAQSALSQSLQLTPAYEPARLVLAQLLLQADKSQEALAILHDGLILMPRSLVLTMALARLQWGGGEHQAAIVSLQSVVPEGVQSAEYHGLLAAMLQKSNRHAEAIEHYLSALEFNPAFPVFLLGLAISLQAEQRWHDAALAYQSAIDTGVLPAEAVFFAREQREALGHFP